MLKGFGSVENLNVTGVRDLDTGRHREGEGETTKRIMKLRKFKWGKERGLDGIQQPGGITLETVFSNPKADGQLDWLKEKR